MIWNELSTRIENALRRGIFWMYYVACDVVTRIHDCGRRSWCTNRPPLLDILLFSGQGPNLHVTSIVPDKSKRTLRIQRHHQIAMPSCFQKHHPLFPDTSSVRFLCPFLPPKESRSASSEIIHSIAILVENAKAGGLGIILISVVKDMHLRKSNTPDITPVTLCVLVTRYCVSEVGA